MIETKLRETLFSNPDRKLKSIQEMLKGYFRASINISLIHFTKAVIFKRSKKDEETQFSHLSDAVDRMREADPDGLFEVETENSLFQR